MPALGTAELDHFPAFLYVYVQGADAAYQRAMQAGATSIEEPTGTPYGHRRARTKGSRSHYAGPGTWPSSSCQQSHAACRVVPIAVAAS